MRALTRRTFLATAAASAAAQAASSEYPETLTQAARWIADGKISPEELLKATLTRIEQLNPKWNAFITVVGEANSPNPGPLYGLPIAVKDLFDTAGVRTTAASKQWFNRVPKTDAEVVARLNRAGAVIIGKLNMDEFAYNFTSTTSAFGKVPNPWNPACIPGGSSGGSAVAVATGMCLGTLGSDTGGSIRLPAALCGVTGFKPTFGAVDLEGAAPLAWSLDHPGPITRTAEDAALLFNAIRDKPGTPPKPVKEIRIGVPRKSPMFAGLQTAVASAVESAIGELGKLTAGVRDAAIPALEPFPGLPMLPRVYGTVILAEAYAYHADMLARAPLKYHTETRQSIRNGAPITTVRYLRARQEMERLRKSAKATLFADVDLLAMPVAPGVAFPFKARPDLVYLRNTAPWNLYGLPAISIPCGFTKDKLPLPIALQLVGPPGADDTVLATAMAFQRATDWHLRRPI